MKDTVLFDLGVTLAAYFERHEFPGILERGISAAAELVRTHGLLRVSQDAIWRAVKEEDHEAPDYSVRPLEARLARIFQLSDLDDIIPHLCRGFMEPIFALGGCYDDVFPTLRELRSKGLRVAIVSNTTWGSPADLWRKEVDRLGLTDWVEEIVFCRDCGWRKPARHIFEHTLGKLDARPEQCLFVGDDPRWDVAGPRAVGIQAVLLDRGGQSQSNEDAIHSLNEIWRLL